jgi:hypothetical protein
MRIMRMRASSQSASENRRQAVGYDAKIAGPSPECAIRLGTWAAALTTVFAILHIVIGIATPARSGPFAQPSDLIPYPFTDVASFIPGDYWWLYPGFMLALAFVVLMACIHYYAPEGRRLFSQIGLAFAIVYATVITLDYFLQITVVQPGILSGETAGLSLFTQYNPHGIFIALEALGYFMMSVAFLFVAGVFARGRLERALRWLFVGSFILVAGSFFALPLLGYDLVAFEVTVLSINWIVLIVSGVLLSILFRQGVRPA